MAFCNADFITAASASINASIRSFSTRIACYIEIPVSILIEKIPVLIISHVHLS